MAVVAALVAPVALDRDSHPLSTYPMYAHRRAELVEFTVASAVAQNGAPFELSIEAIADTDDPLIANARLRGVRTAEAASALCAEIADRTPTATEISVAIEVHDIVERTAGEHSLVERDELAKCEP